ncbi:MAG: multiheme c-type cytochrome [Desulfobulbaceae bacterium]|nr:multiheme c-type cytochrome [Desulfobulbaceae bacterium]
MRKKLIGSAATLIILGGMTLQAWGAPSTSSRLRATSATWDAGKQQLNLQIKGSSQDKKLTLSYGGKAYTMRARGKGKFAITLKAVCYDSKIEVKSNRGASLSTRVKVTNGNASKGKICKADNNPGGGNGGGSTATGGYQLLAWNDLGMHCMDGSDFSIFSILPPYNNLVAQLVKKGNGTATRVTSGVTITYEAEASLDGKWNTMSSTKSNFWDYAGTLFGVSLAPDVGLTGNAVQSMTPHLMTYNSTHDWWSADGIPTAPKNDDGSYNRYPMVKVVARDSVSGAILATTTTVLPVSDEMDCKKCHGSNAGYTEAQPAGGWINDPDVDKDYKLNILSLHDEKNGTSLLATAEGGTSVLCASCHKSNALGTAGMTGVKSLTAAIHSRHANVLDPANGAPLNDSANRNACYACHPGSTTQCLRGAMGKATDARGNLLMQCQSCHGVMSAVGDSSREGWYDEPGCQHCHHDGIRDLQAVNDLTSGSLKVVTDTRFATNPNTPLAGKSLYRFSTGHGDLQCEACHGATHAIYPSLRAEDNIQSIAAQGHTGTIAECTACHLSVPNTVNGGPHGMHTVGQGWISSHQDVAEKNPASCTACHGNNYEGSPLSRTFSTRTFSVENSSKTFAAGHPISCYDCHNGPGGEGTAPVSSPSAASGNTTSNVSQILSTTCRSCHSNKQSLVSCSNSKWTAHNGKRVSTAIYNAVSKSITGAICSSVASSTGSSQEDDDD